MCLRLQISKKNNSRFCQFSSERVSKSNVNGLLLTEAKYINLSLHYLEQVIVALSEKNRSHIPYRNSMMTSVLRDSLGGNCMTTMIATCSVDKRNIEVNEN
jgi:kinesin family protein 6/9